MLVCIARFSVDVFYMAYYCSLLADCVVETAVHVQLYIQWLQLQTVQLAIAAAEAITCPVEIIV